MKVFSVTGLSGSGKTTTIEQIIKQLNLLGFSVGTVKDIHREGFSIDTEGKNTWRHREAGAQTVAAHSANETAVIYPNRLPLNDLLKHYTQDYVILEGVRDANVPNIAVCHEDAKPNITPQTFAISGRFANRLSPITYHLPVINALTNIKDLVDLIVKKTPPYTAGIAPECGAPTNELGVSLKINGNEIGMVPFVQNVIKNTVLGIVKELNGYANGAEIEIKICK
jgi:molybdopterin-guanine dinucleotide biosynthesis protein B